MSSLLFIMILTISCILSFLAVDHVRRRALTENHLDIPNERSSHQIPTPRGGGLGIFVVTIGAVLVSRSYFSDGSTLTVAIYCLSAAIISMIGWLDDRRSMSALVRLTAYSGAVIIFMLGVGIVDRVQIPLIPNVLVLATIPGVILTFVWLVGFINAFNFMDGIDGIAGAQALIGGCIWCIIFLSEGIWTLTFLSGLIAATSLGFLFLNTPPAKVFMGDVGSTFLGFTLAALPVLAFLQLQNPRLFITGILILGPFIFDTTVTILRRTLHREAILHSHRSHLYQRLVKSGFSHAKVSILYGCLALVSALGGLLYYVDSEVLGTIPVIALLCLYISLLFGVTSVENHFKERVSVSPVESKPVTST